MATWFRTDRSMEEFVVPDSPSLEFLQAKVGGLIHFVNFEDGSALMVNEEGRLLGMPSNPSATALAVLKGWPEVMVGDAVFFSREEMERLESEESDG